MAGEPSECQECVAGSAGWTFCSWVCLEKCVTKGHPEDGLPERVLIPVGPKWGPADMEAVVRVLTHLRATTVFDGTAPSPAFASEFARALFPGVPFGDPAAPGSRRAVLDAVVGVLREAASEWRSRDHWMAKKYGAPAARPEPNPRPKGET